MNDIGNRGFWLSPQGTEYEIGDHFNYIVDNPEIFGLHKHDVRGLNYSADRPRLLAIVMQKGWIRVRGGSKYATVQYWQLDKTLARNITAFLNKHTFEDDDTISLSELSRKSVTNTKVSDIKYANTKPT